MVLFVDSREPNEIHSLLAKRKIPVEVKYLESGDYIFGNVGIERKPIGDLVPSMMGKNRRLWNQLDTLKRTYKIPILLIEGYIDWKDREVGGTLTTILLFWRYQIIESFGYDNTVEIITQLFRKWGIGKSGNVPPPAVKKKTTVADIRWAMLQCVSTIGTTRAKNILKNVGFLELGEVKPETSAKLVKGLSVKKAELLHKVFSKSDLEDYS